MIEGDNRRSLVGDLGEGDGAWPSGSEGAMGGPACIAFRESMECL